MTLSAGLTTGAGAVRQAERLAARAERLRASYPDTFRPGGAPRQYLRRALRLAATKQAKIDAAEALKAFLKDFRARRDKSRKEVAA